MTSQDKSIIKRQSYQISNKRKGTLGDMILKSRGVRSRKKVTRADQKKSKKTSNPKFTEKSEHNANPNLRDFNWK